MHKLAQSILDGNRRSLAKVITMAESSLPNDQNVLMAILDQLMPHTGNSIRIGITGVPGAGKSTFIEALGQDLLKKGHKVAVLAVDPSSPKSGGSILGDKTRMEKLSQEVNAFIRPSPTKESLGGVTKTTRETIHLCEAAGYDIILIETVGVGQSEYIVSSMVDLFFILMLPNAGDELQGIKKGILELADTVIINKADGAHLPHAEMAKRQYENALHIVNRDHFWQQNVLTCSSLEHTGFDEIINSLNKFKNQSIANGFFDSNRQEQQKKWFNDNLKSQFETLLTTHSSLKDDYITKEKEILAGEVTPYTAAQKIINKIIQKLDK